MGRTREVPTPHGKPRSQPGRGGSDRSGGFRRCHWQQGLCDRGSQGASMRRNAFPRIFPSLSSPKVQDPGGTSQLAELIPGWAGKEEKRRNRKASENSSASTAGGQIPPPSTTPRLHFKEVTLKEIWYPWKSESFSHSVMPGSFQSYGL